MSTPPENAVKALVEAHIPAVDADVAALHLTLLHLGRVLRAALVHPTTGAGLGGTEYAVLLDLLFAGPPHTLSPTVLSRDVAQTSSGVSKTIRRLERAGLVSQGPNPADLRSRSVTLTDAGREAARQQVAVMVERWRELFGDLDQAAISELDQAVRVILGHLSS